MLSRIGRLAAFIGHARARYLLLACGLLIGLVLAGGTLVLLLELRRHDIADAELELRDLTLVLAADSDRGLQAVERVQFGLIKHLRELGIDSPERLEAEAGSFELYRSALSLTLGGIPRFEEFRFDGSQRRFAGRVHRMGQALTITRTDHCAADLRAAASKSDDAAQVRRLLAIALALDGDPRSEAAERSGMDRQTLRDWVHRYNDGGIDGLKSRSSPGRAPRLTDAQKAELKALVIAGPDPEHDGVVRWRCADLQAVIERRFSVQVHESTVGKWLHQLGLTRLQPRPVHPKKDPAAEQAFKKTSAPC